MRKVIISSSKKFKKDKMVVRKTLGKLDRVLGLKGTYLEVYLVDGDFNVCAFEPPENFPRPDIGLNYKNLGEIYICPAQVNLEVRGGRWGGASYEKILVFLLIHGLLHLLGYDHKKDSDTIKMERKERQLLRLFKQGNDK